jgi:hypothetical protein
MDFYFNEKIKWSDVNPLNHAVRNEYVGNLMNLVYAVCKNVNKVDGLRITNGFVCKKLIDGVQKDPELRSLVADGRCIGFTFDGYSMDSFVEKAKELKEIGVGSYLSSVGFYAVLGQKEVKVRQGNNWTTVDR